MTTRMTWCTRPRAGSPPPLFWTLPPRRTDVHEEVPRPRPPVCLQDISLLVRRSVSVCSDRAPWNFTFSKRQFVFFHRHVKMGWPIKGKACISFFYFKSHSKQRLHQSVFLLSFHFTSNLRSVCVSAESLMMFTELHTSKCQHVLLLRSVRMSSVYFAACNRIELWAFNYSLLPLVFIIN